MRVAVYTGSRNLYPDMIPAVKSMLIQKQSAEFIHNWIIKKQKETYIQIDPRWAGCDFQFPNWVH